MVIRDGKIANYHPCPPTPWNGSVRDSYGTPGPYKDAVLWLDLKILVLTLPRLLGDRSTIR